MQEQKKVGIIGAGPSGLLAAKYALQNGFFPVVFEKGGDIGGVWSHEDGAVWQDMTTNLSKYNCKFSDFEWPEGTPIFPPSAMMTSYLQDYATKFDLRKYIKFNCEVVLLAKNSSSYKIKYKNGQETVEEDFKFVIVASGIFVNPNIPNIKGIQKFSGWAFHSKHYRKGSDFTGKKVLVIGGSFTGVELVGDLSKYTSEVVHSFHRPFWVLSHYLPCGPPKDGKIPKLPVDYFYNRKAYEYGETASREESNLKKNSFYSMICSQQQKIPELAVPKDVWKTAVYITISSSYIPQVKEKAIRIKRSQVKEVNESTVLFEDGSQENFDQIIFCTGYNSSLGFLDKEIQEIIKFNPEDRLQPVILYKEAYHPSLPNLFFVGVYKGPYFAILQLQVKLAFNSFMGVSNLPEREIIEADMKEELAIRSMSPRQQFPHPEYIKFGDDIAQIMDKNFPLQQFLKDQTISEEVKKKFFNMVVFPGIPGAFSLENLEEKIKSSASIVKKSMIYE